MNLRNFSAALAAALIGHFLVLYCPLPLPVAAPFPLASLPIVLETLPPAAPPKRIAGVRGHAKAGFPGQGGLGMRGLTLKQLGISPTPYGEFSLPDGIEPPAGSGDGIRGTPLEGVGELVKNERFFDEIDAALSYPAEFLAHDIGGRVDAELFFAQGSRFEETRSRVQSSSRYLRVHVLRTVRRVFSDGVLWARPADRDFILLCTFYFDRVKQRASLSQRLSPRKLVFYRYGALPGEWRLGPVHGVGAMPAVGVDPNWFLELFQTQVETDPLETYRRDPAW